MDQFDNRENLNSEPAAGENPAQGANPNYTPLSSFANKPSEEPQPQQAAERPSYTQPSYSQPSYAQHTAPKNGAEPSEPKPQASEPAFHAPASDKASDSAPENMQQPQVNTQNYGYNQNSGEYRYVPPFNRENVTGSVPPPPRPPMYNNVPHNQSGAPKYENNQNKNKNKRSFSAGAIVLIVCACVLLSFGSGMLGSMLVGGTSAGGSNGDPIIINKTEGSKNGSGDDESNDSGLVDVCARVSDSVVEITTEYTTTYGNHQYVREGAGSGVIISENGYIITNNHVIAESGSGEVADGVTVRLTDGTEFDAEVIGHDTDSDIAVLKINAEGLSAATIGDSDALKVGERIVAVGNPLGQLGGTKTSGIISATSREISVENNMMTLIQVDAAINPGNSGGGLFNMDGELVGIVNAKSTGDDVEGLGFAIPINEAIDIAGELQSNGYVSGRTYIGISLADVTDSFTAYNYFRSENAGVYISQVQEGYNDDVLKYGDRIIAIDGDEISSSQDVKAAVKSHSVNDKMKFTISRQGKFMDVEVTCYEYVPGGVSFKK